MNNAGIIDFIVDTFSLEDSGYCISMPTACAGRVEISANMIGGVWQIVLSLRV